MSAPANFKYLPVESAAGLPLTRRLDPRNYNETVRPYRTDTAVRCAFNGCGVMHNNGFAVSDKAGFEYCVGWVCGTKHIGESFTTAGRTQLSRIAKAIREQERENLKNELAQMKDPAAACLMRLNILLNRALEGLPLAPGMQVRRNIWSKYTPEELRRVAHGTGQIPDVIIARQRLAKFPGDDVPIMRDITAAIELLISPQ